MSMKEISYDGPIKDKEELDAERMKLRSTGSPTVPPLRTYRSDVAVAMKKQGTTQADIVIAEANRREERAHVDATLPPKKHEVSHLGKMIFILLLLLAFGVGVGVYVLIGPSSPLGEVANQVKVPPPTTNSVGISLSHAPRAQVTADVGIVFKGTTLPDGGVRGITLTQTDTDGTSRPATSREVIQSLTPIPLPGVVLDPLYDDLSFSIRSNNGLAGVLSFPTGAGATTRGAFFDIEPRLADMFVPLLMPTYPANDLLQYKDRSFHDERLGEFDARVLQDPIGHALLVYGVIENSTLVIAGSRETFIAQARSLTSVAQ